MKILGYCLFSTMLFLPFLKHIHYLAICSSDLCTQYKSFEITQFILVDKLQVQMCDFINVFMDPFPYKLVDANYSCMHDAGTGSSNISNVE